MKIVYNPDDHSYTVDGEPCVSVTQVLKELGMVDYSGIPEDILKYAATRGTYVHKAIDLHFKGILNEATLDPVIKPYFEGFKKFISQHEIKTIETEKVMGIKHLRIAGTLDWVGFVDGVRTLIDWKCTSVVKKVSALQAGGYQFLYDHDTEPGGEIERIMVVQLTKGSYRLMPKEFYSNDEANEFYVCLMSLHLRRKYKEV